ncbi:MAG: TIR domain-containing protein [Chloroflexi bacterium]|nr:TIR domain-containing protein [Chloroflexota bacterium]
MITNAFGTATNQHAGYLETRHPRVGLFHFPGDGGILIMRLDHKQKYQVTGRTADLLWMQINANGIPGWVDAQHTQSFGVDFNRIPITVNNPTEYERYFYYALNRKRHTVRWWSRFKKKTRWAENYSYPLTGQAIPHQDQQLAEKAVSYLKVKSSTLRSALSASLFAIAAIILLNLVDPYSGAAIGGFLGFVVFMLVVFMWLWTRITYIFKHGSNTQRLITAAALVVGAGSAIYAGAKVGQAGGKSSGKNSSGSGNFTESLRNIGEAAGAIAPMVGSVGGIMVQSEQVKNQREVTDRIVDGVFQTTDEPKAIATVSPIKNHTFISYRRSDSSDAARLLYDRLTTHFGQGGIFLDREGLFGGDDWAQKLDERLAECKVMLAIIGPDWYQHVLKDEHGNWVPDEAGNPMYRRRLLEEKDVVRRELVAAVNRDIPIIPIILSSGEPPAKKHQEYLPPELHDIYRFQYLILDPDHYDSVIGKIINAIQEEIGSY